MLTSKRFAIMKEVCFPHPMQRLVKVRTPLRFGWHIHSFASRARPEIAFSAGQP
jgi:hypothetical protein